MIKVYFKILNCGSLYHVLHNYMKTQIYLYAINKRTFHTCRFVLLCLFDLFRRVITWLESRNCITVLQTVNLPSASFKKAIWLFEIQN